MTHAIIPHVASADDPAPLPTGWAAARARLDGLPGGGLTIAHEAVDRHVAAGHGAQPALIWLGRGGEREVLTYADLAAAAARFAHVLRAHGIAPGERLFLIAGRASPRFMPRPSGRSRRAWWSAPSSPPSAPAPLRARMEIGAAAALVTSEAQYRRKIADWRAEIPGLRLVLIIGETAGEVAKAFVTLKAGFTADAALERDLRGHARKRLGPAVAPREIVFRDTLPRTRSGKIMRRLLRARKLGLPEGDLSTLEGEGS